MEAIDHAAKLPSRQATTMDNELPTPKIKRAFDISMSFLLIVLSSCIMLLIIISYWITRNTPVLFYQSRIGKGGRIFTLIKFRTLSITPPLTPPGCVATDRNSAEERTADNTFKLGTILRTTSLDELPQLFQVFTGKISLVGPRPLLPEYQNLFTPEQNKRHRVLPGITGWAQVNGRHSITWKKKFELDNYYIDHWSFLFDLKILIKTIGIIFSFKPDVSLKESKFTGKES